MSYLDNSLQRNLLNWFKENSRPLPWRVSLTPYRVWISEVMLQQTTSAAVVPYFESFMQKFPDLTSLATAPEAKVLAAWSGLGYYSRARNLHRCAQILCEQYKGRIPKTHDELLKLPGFGPYTSRSVASIAYGHAVGVLDGNVIRLLSRYYARAWQWWKTTERRELQELADQWVQGASSSLINQAMMEVGSTLCLPKKPTCLLCPLAKGCQAMAHGSWDDFPARRKKRPTEIWIWEPKVHFKDGSIRLTKNDYTPFLKKSWFLEGRARQVNAAPSKYDFRHAITHHDIYVRIQVKNNNNKEETSDLENVWVMPQKSREWAPASLVQKTIARAIEKIETF